MNYRVTLLKGDGIGPEVISSVCQIFNAARSPIEWEEMPAGAGAVDEFGLPMPEITLNSIRKNRLGLKGPLMTPKGKGFGSANVALRKALNLYVGLRPVKSLPGVKTPYKNVDIVLFRENTEDLYSGIEHEVLPGTVITIKTSTQKAAKKIAHWGFEYMRYEGRRKVHCCHKAPIVPMADGAFLDAFKDVASEYPYIQSEDIFVDNLAMALAMNPDNFDVLLLQNLYGDIISDLAGGLVGGLGVVPGANIGDRIAVFEAVHGTAPDIAGQGKANPLAILNSALLLLRYVGERKIADRIERAVFDVLEEGVYLTADLCEDRSKGVPTQTFTDAIIDKL
ncbi:MAG: isocitrate dehydrogenase [Proteobacteria bacterium]|nr:isocitrate dehydrogenase [Pseudomonadota bacterium]